MNCVSTAFYDFYFHEEAYKRFLSYLIRGLATDLDDPGAARTRQYEPPPAPVTTKPKRSRVRRTAQPEPMPDSFQMDTPGYAVSASFHILSSTISSMI